MVSSMRWRRNMVCRITNAARRAGAACAIAAAAWSCAAFAQSPTVEDFYKSHPITMLIGSGAGGGYDVYARVFARYWTNHIPGNPTFIPKNMPAAGGLALASTLFNGSERGGSVIGAFTDGGAVDAVL